MSHEPLTSRQESCIPRHRYSARAIGLLGDQAVEAALEELEEKSFNTESDITIASVLEPDFEVSELYGDTSGEDGFIAGLGLELPPTPKFFVNGKTYEKLFSNSNSYNGESSVAHYAPGSESIVVIKETGAEGEFNKKLQKVLYVHELAHASSHWAYFPHKPKSGGIEFNRLRTGFHTAHQDNRGEKIENGICLEEAFASYIHSRYVKEMGYNFRHFIGTIHNEDFQLIELEGLPSYGIIAHPESQLLDMDFSKRINFIANHVVSKGQVLLYPWHVIQEDDKNTKLGVNLQSVLGMAFDLLIQHDEHFLDALIASRKTAEGLRKVCDKLNTLEPGLYKKLRDLDYDPAGIYTFYDSVVKAIDGKLPQD